MVVRQIQLRQNVFIAQNLLPCRTCLQTVSRISFSSFEIPSYALPVGTPRPGTRRRNPGQVSHICMPLFTKQYKDGTGQRAVMPCGWGVKADMVCVRVAGKTVGSPCYTPAISEHFRGAAWRSTIQIHVYFTLLYFTLHADSHWDHKMAPLICTT